MLFTPSRHEQLAGERFDETDAHQAIARIVARAELELDRHDGRWPIYADDAVHPDEAPPFGLYSGAAGLGAETVGVTSVTVPTGPGVGCVPAPPVVSPGAIQA